MYDVLLKEAVRIGDELLDKAIDHNDGFSWKTLIYNTNTQKCHWQQNESIYSGTAGIVLFFLELYKQTKNSSYIHAAKKGADWLIYHCRKNPSSYYAFYTGRMGVSYTDRKSVV